MKKVTILIATIAIMFASSVSADTWVKNIQLPLSISKTAERETPYYLFYKIDNTTDNEKILNSGFAPILPNWNTSRECITGKDDYGMFNFKPDCNKIDISWYGLGNPKTTEFAEAKIIMLNVDLWKRMDWKEEWNFIRDLTENTGAILSHAYVMKVNPKYYQTKELSSDWSVYLLPIEKYDLTGLKFAFNREGMMYYVDKDNNYYESTAGTILKKIFKNDAYETKTLSDLKSCGWYNDIETMNTSFACTSRVLSSDSNSIAGKISDYENHSGENKDFYNAIDHIFD